MKNKKAAKKPKLKATFPPKTPAEKLKEAAKKYMKKSVVEFKDDDGEVRKLVCCFCGTPKFSEHAISCRVAISSHAAGTNQVTYSKTPSLWCPVISDPEGDEPVRCVLPGGEHQHNGLHAFPVDAWAIALQKRLGALADAKKQARKAALHVPVAVGTDSRDVSAPRVKRAPKGEQMGKVIHLLVKDNPFKSGSKVFERFKVVTEGMKVSESVQKGFHLGDIGWSVKHNFMELRDA